MWNAWEMKEEENQSDETTTWLVIGDGVSRELFNNSNVYQVFDPEYKVYNWEQEEGRIELEEGWGGEASINSDLWSTESKEGTLCFFF